jgi:hypothetical protein
MLRQSGNGRHSLTGKLQSANALQEIPVPTTASIGGLLVPSTAKRNGTDKFNSFAPPGGFSSGVDFDGAVWFLSSWVSFGYVVRLVLSSSS